MAILHGVIVVANSAAARAAIYGSAEELTHFGTVLANTAALGVDGGRWGQPTVSGNTPPLYAWGVWASTINPTPATLTKLRALVASGTVKLFTWDPIASPETYDAYLARWKAAVGWIDVPVA